MSKRTTRFAFLKPLAFAASAVLWWTLANAHSWYPYDCCAGDDCEPVDSMSPLLKDGAPQWVITSKRGTVSVPRDFPMRESQDGRMHVCTEYNEWGDLMVKCIFAPPNM